MTNEILEKGKELSELIKLNRERLYSFKDKTPLYVVFPGDVRISLVNGLQDKVKTLLMEAYINRIHELEKEFEAL